MEIRLHGDACRAKLQNQGNVEDCDIVMGKSQDYREGQDYLSEFLKEKIQKKDGKKIKKTELYETFKQWYTIQHGGRPPKGKEIYDMMDRRYGKYKNGWFNVEILYDDEDSDIEDMGMVKGKVDTAIKLQFFVQLNQTMLTLLTVVLSHL